MSAPQKFVALFTGINVGSAKRIKMPALCAIFVDLGFNDVESYVQSGNVVFSAGSLTADEAAAMISEAFPKAAGFTSTVMVRSAADWQKLVDGNPFPEALAEPKWLHAFVLDAAPSEQALAALAKAGEASPNEHWQLRENVLYLHTPDGFGTSKLGNVIPRLLKVGATARNWRTVMALLEMTA